MANIKKSFNFRNGVQVDDDNLKVSATGLVGIGTTVPTEALDVRGNLIVSGVSSAVTAQAGVMTVTTLNPTEIIGAGVSIVSGIVTASSGIITFYGDARFLQGMPTSQWEDTNTGLGVSSIYNTGGNVGIATSNPQFTLQIGENPNQIGGVSGDGVGISSFGDIKASGIVTATTFSGNLSGDVTGDVTGTVTGNINSGLGTITDINATNINVSGLSTFAGITSVTGPVFHSNQLDISGISTMRGGISIPFSNGQENLQIGFVKNNLIDVTGIASIGTRLGSQDLHLSAGGPSPDPNTAIFLHRNTEFLQQIEVKGGSTFRQPMNTDGISNGTSNITSSGFIQSFNKVVGTEGVESNEIAVGRKTITGVVGHPRMIHTTQNGPLKLAGYNSSGVEVEGLLNSKGTLQGLGNIIANSNNGKIGVGTISPVGDIHLRRYTGDAEIQVTAEAGTSRVSLGVESGTGQTNHTELRYNLTGQNQFDGTESFSIVNFGKGNFNYMMSAANANAATGNFFWMKGNGLSGTLMTLTPTGRLGIGLTTPLTPLHVLGDATVSGTLTVGNNLQIEGTLNANVEGNVSGNLTGNVNGNANANAGISTFNNLSVAGISTFNNIKSNSIGIATDPTLPLTINSQPDNRFFVNANGNVGIKTTSTDGNQLLVGGSISTLLIGVGTTQPLSAVDFSLAGQTLAGNLANKMYMIPPKVSNTQRGNLAGLVSGSLIYNTNSNDIQVYNGSSWGSLGSGGGEANQNAFSNVAVSGQTTVAADTSTDTLTLAAGSNVSITTNAGSDTVTISATDTNTSTFAGLTDTPGSLTARKYLRVNSAGNALELKNSGLGDGFVNAADYGIDASATDGTNVTAINNAIAALGTNGGTIVFPGGMFYLNAAISLGNSNNSIRFVGSGHQNYGGGSDAGGTVLRRDADDEFFNITNSRAIHFIGITFKGGAANGNGGNSGISGGDGAIHVLANAGCQGYLIENCVFHGIANCITFKGLSDSIIRGCRFRNVPSNEGNGACIALNENGSEVIDQIRIQDCVIDGSPDGSAINTAIDGIAIYNTVSTVYVTNTSAIRLKRSFYSDANWDGNFFYFQNSEAERANEDGFSINGTGNFVTIDNCFACTNGQGGTGHGINIGASQNSSLNITNPNVRDNSGHGILINGPTNNCSIVNPAIGGNSRGSSGTNHGIVIGTNTNNVYITGGKIGGNTDELAGTGTQGRGIQIDGTAHDNIRIIGTNVTGNQNAEGINQNIGSGTGNSIQFNAGSAVAIDS